MENNEFIRGNETIKKYADEWGEFDFAEKKTEPYQYKYNEKNKNILMFNMPLSMFLEFIKNPSEDFLQSTLCMSTDKLLIGELSYENIVEKGESDFFTYLMPTIVNNKDYYVYHSSMFDYYYNNSNVVLRKTFIDYLDIGNIQKLLLSKGINEKVEDRAIIETSYYNLLVWIKTEENIYLLEMKDAWQPETYNDNELFNVKQFKDVFTPKTGKLIIDNVEIQGDDNVIFYKDYSLVKTRPVWESLSGQDVVWDEKDLSVSFNYNGEKIQLKKNEYGSYEYFKNGEKLFDYFKFVPFIPKNLNSFYWSSSNLEYDLKKIYNKELISNSDLLTVTIN